ncbi:hypothetical protein AK812_SmicGene24750 [Symbiodinium microadriaticum]|uniref:Uncharacterized protein n=1 Tax=Symbiodinium microadriaticum TaxID=2951 RepID=A0A1Q9DDR3_SYMMI|nr:hypothetical protein AK812_SmicGene24750 [Symbiodinium microadriaticum]CAE7452619.1 unnamed protein product [Symbiodinium microadriaticum]
MRIPTTNQPQQAGMGAKPGAWYGGAPQLQVRRLRCDLQMVLSQNGQERVRCHQMCPFDIDGYSKVRVFHDLKHSQGFPPAERAPFFMKEGANSMLSPVGKLVLRALPLPLRRVGSLTSLKSSGRSVSSSQARRVASGVSAELIRALVQLPEGLAVARHHMNTLLRDGGPPADYYKAYVALSEKCPQALQPKTASFTSSAQDLLCQVTITANFFGRDCVVLKFWLRVHAHSLKSMAMEDEIIKHSLTVTELDGRVSRLQERYLVITRELGMNAEPTVLAAPPGILKRKDTIRGVEVELPGGETAVFHPADAQGGIVGYLLFYLDDILLAASLRNLFAIRTKVSVNRKVKDQGILVDPVDKPVKDEVERSHNAQKELGCWGMRKGFTGDGDLECHQILYVKRCLKERGFSDLSLPNIQEGMEPEFDHRSCDEYRGLLRKGQQEIGSLLWASQRTRPDIAAVTGVCGTSTKSKEWSHQAWRYLAATLEHKVVFDRQTKRSVLEDNLDSVCCQRTARPHAPASINAPLPRVSALMGRKRSSLDDALATARIPYGEIGPAFCRLRRTCRSLGLRGRMLSLFLQLLRRPGARASLPSPPPARPKHECARLASKVGRAAPATPRLRTGTVTSTRLRYTFLISNRCGSPARNVRVADLRSQTAPLAWGAAGARQHHRQSDTAWGGAWRRVSQPGKRHQTYPELGSARHRATGMSRRCWQLGSRWAGALVPKPPSFLRHLAQLRALASHHHCTSKCEHAVLPTNA